MNKKDIKYSSSNLNKINDESNAYNNNLYEIKLIISFEFLMKEYNLNMTLIDLKKCINSRYHLKENEYEIYIGENNISNLPHDTLISNIIKKFNLKDITIKTFKNFFDVNKEFGEYERFLTNNISLKNDDINMLINEYKNIKEDLNI